MNVNQTIRKLFSRAAMMLLATILLSMTAQPAWAETVVNGVKYIDANGVEQTRDGVIVLTGSETKLGVEGTESSPTETWYLCNSTTLNYTSTLSSNIYSNVNIILADGVEMSVEPSSSNAIYIQGSLGIYGQSTGTNRGALTAKGASCGIWVIGSGNNVTISGAKVTATGDRAIYSSGGGVSITGSKVTATGTERGIFANGDDNGDVNLTIIGSEVTATATGTSGYAIFSSCGSISISDAEVTATATATSGYAICSNSGGVSITGGKVTANGTKSGIEACGSDKDITIIGAEVEATATGTSGYAIIGKSGGVSITGGKVTAKGTYCGIEAWGSDKDITIKGAEVTATADGTSGHAIYSYDGGVSITGGKITANGKDYGIAACGSDKDITIKDAEVTATVTGSYSYAINSSNGGVSITGGKVTANGKYYGINAYGSGKDITVKDAEVTVTVTGDSGYAIFSYGGVSITGGKVTAKGTSYGIEVSGSDKDVTIKDAEVTAEGNYAIYTPGGGISITGGKVTANGTEFGIEASGSNKDVTIKDAEVTATADGSSGYAIYCSNGGVSITGGKVTANGKDYGIAASGSDKNITIKDAEVTAEGKYSIYSSVGDVSITGGKITANGTSIGIGSNGYDNGDVTIIGSEVTATANGTSGKAISTYGGNITIKEGAEVTAEGNNAIYATGGGISITGGKVTANGTEYGIGAGGSDKDITISGAEVTATANGTSGKAIYIPSGNVSITGGEVTANGTTYGINGSIIINDGTVSITGATAISNINSYVVNGGKVTLNSTSGDVYKVTFDGNEWSDIPEVSLYSGSTVAEPTAPTRKGYIFGGWKNGSTLYDFNMPVTGNLTLVSVWEMKTLTHTDITIADIADQICTGSEIKPAVTIKDGETDLTENVDYEVAYADNTHVGTATVTITGKDGYAGTVTKTFVIKRQMKDLFAGGNQWTGYVAEEDLDLPAGLTAYVITALGEESATATALSYIPQGVPVLLSRADKDANLYLASAGTGTAPTTNLLKVASTTVQPVAYQDYALYKDAFILYGGGTLASGKVFLPLPQSSKSRSATRSIVIDGDDTTGMSEALSVESEESGDWYDLQGRRLEGKPLKRGLYIHNGQKTVIK